MQDHCLTGLLGIQGFRVAKVERVGASGPVRLHLGSPGACEPGACVRLHLMNRV